MTVRTIEYLLNKFGAGKSPGSSEYVDLIDTLADDRNAVYFSATAPADTAANPLWFNTTTNVLSVYDGEWFSTPGPQGPAGTNGTNGTTPDTSIFATLANPTFTGTATTNNLIVDGDFTVNGTNFNASATSITIEDNLLQLAHQNAANTVDLGLVVGYNDGTAKHAGLVKDTSASTWKLFKGVTTEPATTVDFTQGSLDDLELGAITATSANIGNTTITGTLAAGSSVNKTTAYPVEPSGTTSGTVTTSAQMAGFLGMPQNPETATGTFSYTLAASDAGKHIYYTGTPSSAALVIPANSAVAFEIGTTIVVMNDLGAATNISISITTDTLQLAGTGTTGTRTLARYGVASMVKVTATKWIISGNGLT